MGDRHPHFGFLQLLSRKCLFSIFSSEHVQCILDQLLSDKLGNKNLEDSSLKLLLVRAIVSYNAWTLWCDANCYVYSKFIFFFVICHRSPKIMNLSFHICLIHIMTKTHMIYGLTMTPIIKISFRQLQITQRSTTRRTLQTKEERNSKL